MEITANKLTFIIILIALPITIIAYLIKVNPPPSDSEISGDTENHSVSANIISPDKPLAPSGRWPIFRADSGLNGIAGGSLTDNLPLSWSFKTEGEIRSSAVIGGGLVFSARTTVTYMRSSKKPDKKHGLLRPETQWRHRPA